MPLVFSSLCQALGQCRETKNVDEQIRFAHYLEAWNRLPVQLPDASTWYAPEGAINRIKSNYNAHYNKYYNYNTHYYFSVVDKITGKSVRNPNSRANVDDAETVDDGPYIIHVSIYLINNRIV